MSTSIPNYRELTQAVSQNLAVLRNDYSANAVAAFKEFSEAP